MHDEVIRLRAFEISREANGRTPDENWTRAEQELAVAYDYDTADRDLEQLGMTLSRLPSEAGVVWRLCLPDGRRVEDWEPGNHGLTPPVAIAELIATVVAGKPLEAAPPISTDPGAVRLRAMLEAQRRALLAHDPGVRLGHDPESLHQHRVAARRARAFLRATRESLDREWRSSLEIELRELGAVTGPVRDLDVLLEHLAGELTSLDDADEPAGRQLVAVLAREREAARQRLLDALDGDAYRGVLARLRVPPRLAEDVEKVPLERIARSEFRRLVRAVDKLGKRSGEPAIHALRIRLKRVRYAAELAAPAGKARRQFLADARALQDLLGEYQDSVVAEQRLRAAAVSDTATAIAFVAGRIAHMQHARRARVREQLPVLWKRLRKSGQRLGG